MIFKGTTVEFAIPARRFTFALELSDIDRRGGGGKRKEKGGRRKEEEGKRKEEDKEENEETGEEGKSNNLNLKGGEQSTNVVRTRSMLEPIATTRWPREKSCTLQQPTHPLCGRTRSFYSAEDGSREP